VIREAYTHTVMSDTNSARPINQSNGLFPQCDDLGVPIASDGGGLIVALLAGAFSLCGFGRGDKSVQLLNFGSV
jgi:hypothetical protein